MCQFPEDLEVGIVNSKEIKSVSGKTDASKGNSPVLPTGTKLINFEVSYDCTWLDLIVIRIYICEVFKYLYMCRIKISCGNVKVCDRKIHVVNNLRVKICVFPVFDIVIWSNYLMLPQFQILEIALMILTLNV